MSHVHSHKCRYKDTDKLQYALIELTEDKLFLIAAEEVEVFDTYLEHAKNQDKDVVMDLDQSDEEPLQIVYGGMLLNTHTTAEKAYEIAEQLAGFALFDLEEERVNVSGYKEICFYPEHAETDNYIPFAALMQTTHRFENRTNSITMFPSMKGSMVWEAMVNRPFVLACREGMLIEGIKKENWKSFIIKEKLLAAYVTADLVTD